MRFTNTWKERVFYGNPIDPASKTAGTYDTGGIDMSKCTRAVFELMVGDMQATSTVDMKLQESADDVTYTDVSGGSGNSITQLTGAGADDNKIVTLECRADQLSSGMRYLRARVTVAVDASILGVMAKGFDCTYEPANGFNNAAVDEQVVKVSA
jgi:hypothetical protein